MGTMTGLIVSVFLISIVALVALTLSIAALVQIRKEIKRLDPKKIAEMVLKDLKELPKDIREQIRGIVRSETENINDHLKKNETEIEAQKEKLNNLRFRIRENGQKVVNGISNLLKEVFGPILKEKPDETISLDESEAEETPDDKKTTAGSEQQTAEEEVSDDT